ncbi:MAG: hypothetical protein Q9227_004073 [Pyrenula ochraceoflavens]
MDREVLPSSVVPSHYDLSLAEIDLAPPWKYKGTVKINVDIVTPVQKIVLNAALLDIKGAKVYTKGGKGCFLHDQRKLYTHLLTACQVLSKTDNITYNPKCQQATLSFPEELSPSDVILDIEYEGTINTELAGFYRSRYESSAPAAARTPSDGEHEYMYSTQFEACDARKAFPCFDQPDLKATFNIQIELPKTLVALSNMPVRNEWEGREKGLKVVAFETTPKMSTYLAAWAVGDFEYIESSTNRTYNGMKIPVRVYCTRGLKDKAHYALEHAGPTLDYFSELFGIDYPLPKADLLAVHDFALGAMENWGLVTYRANQVLFDEKESDPFFRNRIAYVVCHELAHQWYGNLVTFSWWNDIWLNEGFATWAGWLAVSHHHPEWDVWSQFISGVMEDAFRLDSVRASHPVEVSVRNALEIDQAFDAISYNKGSSVIRMLSDFLGQDVFLSGVSMYLKKHAYANTTTDDLWAALSAVSGHDVKKFMDPWIRKIGFPALTVAEEPGQITVRQERFLSTGDIKTEDDQTTWWIPLGLRSSAESALTPTALTTKEDTIRDLADFYKLNKNHAGVYRTNYPPERLTKLGQAQNLLSSQDKVGLLSDVSAFAISGGGTTTSLLSLLQNFRNETNYHVWTQINASLSNARSIFATDPSLTAGLRKFALYLYTPLVEAMGWDDKPTDTYLTIRLRKLALSAAGFAGHPPTISEARSRFTRWQSGEVSAVPGSLRITIFRLVVAEGGREEYEAMKKEYFDTTAIDGKDISLACMGETRDPALARDVMEFVTSEQVRTQNAFYGPWAIGENTYTTSVAWEYIRDNWNKVYQRMGGNKIVFDRFIRPALVPFSQKEKAKEIREFFERDDIKAQTGGIERTLEIAQDYILGNAAYRERDEAKVREWLDVNGYM